MLWKLLSITCTTITIAYYHCFIISIFIIIIIVMMTMKPQVPFAHGPLRTGPNKVANGILSKLESCCGGGEAPANKPKRGYPPKKDAPKYIAAPLGLFLASFAQSTRQIDAFSG